MYEAIYATNPALLVKKMNDRIMEGWEPFGAPMLGPIPVFDPYRESQQNGYVLFIIKKPQHGKEP